MEIPEKTLRAVKKAVFDIFDNGKVQDVTLRIGEDWYGEECLCVRLHVVPGDAEDYKGRLIRVPYEVKKVLDGNLEGLHPFVELRNV